jgi:hypothetical protein
MALARKTILNTMMTGSKEKGFSLTCGSLEEEKDKTLSCLAQGALLI